VTIFAGTTGFDKSAFVKQFAQTCLQRNDYPGHLDSPDARSFIQYIKFEDELLTEDSTSTDIPGFLEKPSFREKCRTIERTFKRIGEEISVTSAHLFLDIHLSYYKGSQFLPPFSASNFQALVPGENVNIKVITLIDDVFVVWRNLRDREQDYPETSLRLREILAWRSLEMLQAEAVADNYTTGDRNVANFLVAVRHPTDTLYNLIFRPKPNRAYISFPITNTRNVESRVSEVNDFRKDIHALAAKKHVAIFDPVTIDELALKSASDKGTGDPVILQKGMRWPLNFDGQLVKEPVWPIEIPRQEIQEVLPDITNNIRARDFKLIDNSLLTIAYRPRLGGESGGVRQEMEYTVNTGKRVYAYNPIEDTGSKKGHPFHVKINEFSDKQEFLRKVERAFSATY
jgi:hypothetical protein